MSDFDPRFDPAFQRGYDAPVRPAKASRPTESEAVSSVPVPNSEERPSAKSESEAAPRRTNPFLIALTALSAAMIAAGLVVATRLGDIFNSTQFNSELDYVSLQIVMIGTPILIGLGIATGVGVLFVFAVRWGR